jgi:hypothetical protein
MAKVVIFEDSKNSLYDRYAHLTNDHDVHVFYCDDFDYFSFVDESLDKMNKNLFKNDGLKGFERDKIHQSHSQIPDDADVYFLDGLNGRCFDILPNLPSVKSYLVTGETRIEIQAKERGYHVAREADIERIVKEHSIRGGSD